MLEMYETGYPWIVYWYPRPDWIAMFMGGKVVCECCICGGTEAVRIPVWDIWFPPKDGRRHPFRDKFLAIHGHPDRCGNRTTWVKLLKNVIGI
jgi:hypothetical protein